ncbi:hypothetical protein DFR58_1262 [Anaerobacterium chartisolvens]|uniref:PD-(D/E)XK nuclease superfamily protein n=1 Tax=Anaerobacterium chartisolvens TaxID=1297424 RepID=A0A369APD1_9FIRM|nr:hypothetical protein [Anaerobacterium chartisolvens]RCX11229.1 hypothetical protein DFR58_1262 [Anaerobacterium chartisolvens]
MITEIYHKNVDTASEDQLTGNVFGALRYLPYPMARQIIINSVLPAATNELLEKTLPSEICDEWGRNVYFWRHYPNSNTEPDVVMELGQGAILIEVKYNSDLSGNDQLIREAELLLSNYPNKANFLLLLAREESAISIFNENKTNIPAEVSFGYITWQRLYNSISKNTAGSLICDDLSALLNEKGFGGFRGFGMMNEETIKAFRIVQETHKNVQEFISCCIALADEKCEFELAPITGNNRFLRWSSDRDSNAWAYFSFIVIFQRCLDTKLKNGYRNGALYVLELNFADYEIPMANVARYDYDNIEKNWSSAPLSPSDHWIFYDPLYNDIIEFPDYECGEMYCGEVDKPISRYWGLKRVMGYEIPLLEITADNTYEKIFGTFKELSKYVY